MKVEDIKNKLNNNKYDFLRSNNYLNNNIILLGLGGSYAYGTNKYYAKQLGCSTRTITNLLKYLADNNYITIINGNSFKRRIYIRNKVLIT